MLRDGTGAADPRLGRCVAFDVRSRNFPAQALIGAGTPLRSRRWRIDRTELPLDQGQVSSCVGNAVTNELRYSPRPVHGLNERFAVERIYWEAQKIDDWPGGEYPGADPQYGGTSVLAGVKAAAAQGWYTEYRWCFGERDLALSVGYLGPVVLGLPWHEAMMSVDRDGYLIAEGAVIGGHAVLCIGYSLRSNCYTIANSWGPWGYKQSGTARISAPTMARLLDQDGEGVVITGRAGPRRVEPMP